MELIAEVPISLLDLNRFEHPGNLVVHAGCEEERVARIFEVSERTVPMHKDGMQSTEGVASKDRKILSQTNMLELRPPFGGET